MWTCPKCGREFRCEGQQHYCGEKPKTIRDYIERQDEAARPYLTAVYETIRQAIPQAEERMSWSMPTFWKGRNLIHFAASRKHLGIYPGPEAVERFKELLTPYHTSKGTIQIPYRKPLPLALIAEIAKWCAREAEEAR